MKKFVKKKFVKEICSDEIVNGKIVVLFRSIEEKNLKTNQYGV